jgi:hypothetical protein
MTFLDMPAVSRNSYALNELRGGAGLEFLRGLIFILVAVPYFTQKAPVRPNKVTREYCAGVIGDFGHFAVWLSGPSARS